LTAALALARNGFRVVVVEQAARLEETGAGIQLSPNASRILIDLGLADRLRPVVTVPTHGSGGTMDEHGMAMIAADGLWSQARVRLGHGGPPRFSGRVAWRGLVPARLVAPEFREPLIHLWLGRDAHFVHYPVKAGSVINLVVITSDRWHQPGWSEPADRAELVPRLAAEAWAPQARALVGLPEAWLKWALYERRPIRRWSKGPVALLGDAAHPMFPFLAQGAGMAIEDAAVAAQCLARTLDDPTGALRIYAAIRRARTRKVQRMAARTGTIYHLAGPWGWLRDRVMRAMGGPRLLQHYDWIYDWRPPAG
jgi:salicylate hydroxylase